MSEWRIEDQSADYQIAYWRRAAELQATLLKAEQKRKAPAQLAELEKEMKRAQEMAEHFRQSEQVWKQVSQKGWARVDELEKDGAAAVLKRERDHWKHAWRNCTRRLGNAIEHLGLDHSGVEPNADVD